MRTRTTEYTEDTEKERRKSERDECRPNLPLFFLPSISVSSVSSVVPLRIRFESPLLLRPLAPFRGYPAFGLNSLTKEVGHNH